jgi:hypothetical protein
VRSNGSCQFVDDFSDPSFARYYDIRPGRTAYVWLVFGDPPQRFSQSVAFVRSADLEATSHCLSFMVHRVHENPMHRELTRQPIRDVKGGLKVGRRSGRRVGHYAFPERCIPS